MLVCNLGNTDEEKFLNIQKINNTRDKFKKLIKILNIFAGVFLIFGALSGAAVVEGGNAFTTILLFVFLLVATYFFTGYVYGTGIAWGIYMITSGVLKIPDSSGVSTEELVRAYVTGGRGYADAIATGDALSTIIAWCITILIGFWGGWYNAIVHHNEVKEITTKMNKKYKK